MSDDFWPPENYYRVSIKALIFDDEGRLLVGKHANGEYSMPGGGWDHGEDFEACVKREVAEELGAEVVSVGKVACFYRHTTEHGRPKVSIALPVKLAKFTFVFSPDTDEAVEAEFVTKQAFVNLNFMESEDPVRAYADQIWAVVEKSNENR